jgi:hypothetical protein
VSAALLLAAALAAAPTAPASDGLAVSGTGIAGVQYSVADLRALPRAKVDWTFRDTTQRCEGVALQDLLSRAGVPSGADVRGPASATVVLAVGADGYAVAFGIGDLDQLLGAQVAVVADRCDGKDLGADVGPMRLVVPGDRRGARSVRNLVALEIERLSSRTVTPEASAAR